MHDLLRTLPPEKKRQWPQDVPQVTYAYNTRAHHTTGLSPYYVMFGCEPKLPVDFLLGVDTGLEVTENWVQQHQDLLTTAHEHVRGQIARKAEANNNKVTDVGFQVDEFVHLENQQVHGRNKIQDRWDPCVYKVVRHPKEGVVVYLVVPIYQDRPVRQVHRTQMRKAVVSNVDQNMDPPPHNTGCPTFT